MAKKEEKVLEGVAKFNRVSKPINILFSVIFIIAALCCVIPVIFIVIISFTHKDSIQRHGFSFFPDQWSLQAYQELWKSRDSILLAFGVSLFVTIVGTLVGLFLNATMGYVLSRRSFKLRGFYTILTFIPMIFSGGMVASYMVITQFLNLRNNFLALILPMCVTPFYIIILRTFFTTTVPDSLIESGKIDGASQLRIFFQIVLPISLPAIATIGLFLSFAYWNDWWLSMMYITNEKMYSLQYLLISIDRNIDAIIKIAAQQGISTAELMQNIPQDGLKMAIVIVAVLPIACSYPFFQKYFVSGLTVGAVKG